MADVLELAPGIEHLISVSNAHLFSGYWNLPVAEQRALYDSYAAALNRPRPAGVESEDCLVDCGRWQLPLRIYRPAQPFSGQMVLFHHGGSFYLGGLDSHDDFAAEIAAETGATLIAVDYPLAPEYPFPEPFDACYRLFCDLAEGRVLADLGCERILLAGDSAGGTLAMAMALKARDEKGPRARGLALVYPYLGEDSAHPPGAAEESQPMLQQEELAFARKIRYGDSDPVADYRSHPLLAESWADLPPSYLIMAEHDPVTAPVARSFVPRVLEAGGAAQLDILQGTTHGFIRARAFVPVVDAGLRRYMAAIREMLSR